jgi:hypothetical protein
MMMLRTHFECETEGLKMEKKPGKISKHNDTQFDFNLFSLLSAYMFLLLHNLIL